MDLIWKKNPWTLTGAGGRRQGACVVGFRVVDEGGNNPRIVVIQANIGDTVRSPRRGEAWDVETDCEQATRAFARSNRPRADDDAGGFREWPVKLFESEQV